MFTAKQPAGASGGVGMAETLRGDSQHDQPNHLWLKVQHLTIKPFKATAYCPLKATVVDYVSCVHPADQR